MHHPRPRRLSAANGACTMSDAPTTYPAPALRGAAAVAVRGRPLDEDERLGTILADSRFFPDVTKMPQAVVKVLAGRELGFGPIASMVGVYMVKGRPSLSANLMAAAVQRTGVFRYRVKKHTDSECEIL